MNCGRRGDAASERALAGAAEVLARLESYRLGLGGDHPAPFEAEPLLHDLYCLDRVVTSLGAGSTAGLDELHSFQGGAGAYACAGGGWWEEEDEDEEDGDYYGGGGGDGDHALHDGGFDARSLGRAASGLRAAALSRTPGRRPPNRSGSGGAARAGGGGPAGGGGSGGGGGNGGGNSGGRRGGGGRQAR